VHLSVLLGDSSCVVVVVGLPGWQDSAPLVVQCSLFLRVYLHPPAAAGNPLFPSYTPGVGGLVTPRLLNPVRYHVASYTRGVGEVATPTLWYVIYAGRGQFGNP